MILLCVLLVYKKTAASHKGGSSFLRVHTVRLHVVVQHFTVLLLLFLNVVENIAHIFIFKLEDTGIVQVGRVFFSGEKIAAKIIVILFIGVLFCTIGG